MVEARSAIWPENKLRPYASKPQDLFVILVPHIDYWLWKILKRLGAFPRCKLLVCRRLPERVGDRRFQFFSITAARDMW